MAGLSELWSHFARWFAGSQPFQKQQIHQALQKFNVETGIYTCVWPTWFATLMSPFEANSRGQTLGWFREVRYINPPSSWWQLQYFWNFHPETWGRSPIWRTNFWNGLVKNHQLLGGSSQWMYVVRITPPFTSHEDRPFGRGFFPYLGDLRSPWLLTTY